MKIVSWNVNGLKSCAEKGLGQFIKMNDADAYCFQEIKATKETINSVAKNSPDWQSYAYQAEKNGYSGLLILTKKKALSVLKGVGEEQIDREARVLTLEYTSFFLVNVYAPHSHRELKRLSFKEQFNVMFLKFCEKLRKRKPVVIAGDLNVAHEDIDLRNPKPNKGNAGFTETERTWFRELIGKGYIDTFRLFTKDGGHYTWWTYRNNARQRNIGWRIDYVMVSEELKNNIKSSTILNKVRGSDHCPIQVELDIEK